MEPDTVKTPKINKTTFQFAGGLEKRVANNEKKITILKNIFKAQKREIGEKITPKVSNLEQSLLETTNILGDITKKLQLDFSQRLEEQKNLLQSEKQKLTDQKREDAEKKLETKEQKTNKISKSISSGLSKPFRSITDSFMELGLILGGGLLANNFEQITENEKVVGAFNHLKKYWKEWLIGIGIVELIGKRRILKFVAKNLYRIGSYLTKKTFQRLIQPVGQFMFSPQGAIAIGGALGLEYFRRLLQPFQDMTTKANLEIMDTTEKKLKEEGSSSGDAALLSKIFLSNAAAFNLDGGLVSSIRLDPNNYSTRGLSSNLPDDIGGNAFLGPLVNTMINDRNKKQFKPELLKNNPYVNGFDEKFDYSFFNKNIQPLTSIEELPLIDFTKNSNLFNFDYEPSVNSATTVISVSSINSENDYMVETPILLGFNNLVYKD